jgi:hypothetical protein
LPIQAIGKPPKRTYPEHARGTPLTEEPAKTQIFVMLPMDIVTVGELSEGKDSEFPLWIPLLP